MISLQIPKLSLKKAIRSYSVTYQPCYLISQGFDPNKDYYKVLGVSQSALDKQIKAAYFSLAKKYHPDVNKGNAERFKEISDAYSVIGEANKRKEYDAARKFASSNSGFASNRSSQGQQSYGRSSSTSYGQYGQYGQNSSYYNNSQYGQNSGYYNNNQQQQQQSGYYNYSSNYSRNPRAEQEEEMLKSYFMRSSKTNTQDFLKKMKEQIKKAKEERDKQSQYYSYNNNHANYEWDAQPEANTNQRAWAKQAEEAHRKKMEEEYRKFQEESRVQKQKEEETAREAEKKFNEFVGKVSGVGVFLKSLATDFVKNLKK